MTKLFIIGQKYLQRGASLPMHKIDWYPIDMNICGVKLVLDELYKTNDSDHFFWARDRPENPHWTRLDGKSHWTGPQPRASQYNRAQTYNVGPSLMKIKGRRYSSTLAK